MNAKDLLIDFLNYAFLIALVIFCIVFFIVGDRFENFTNILRSLLPLAFFSIIFLFLYKRKRAQKKKREIEEDDYFDEIALVLTPAARIKEFSVISLIAVVNYLLVLVVRGYFAVDLIQVFIIFVAMSLWSIFLLKKDPYSKTINITYRKISEDELIIFLLPMMLYVVVYATGKIPDMTNIFQSIILLLSMYLWHYLLFKKWTLNIQM